MSMASLRFGILTVSDTCYAKINEDRSGPKLEQCIIEAFPQSNIIFKEIVPDSKPMIEQLLTQWSLQPCDVILTTGGTGFSPRDVTPEATRAVIDKEAPGISYAMISRSLQVTDMAMLSRAVCGIKKFTLIINLPGSAKGAAECFGFVKSAIPHAVAVLRGNQEVVREDHQRIQNPLPRPSQNSPSKVKLNQVAKRKRESPYPMLEVEAALKMIFLQIPNGAATEIIDITKCRNRVLAENVLAKDPLPPYPASIKDGYAVRASDGSGVRIVMDVVAAGDAPSPKPLPVGFVIRISTGAPIPEGADAVVQVEDTALVKASSDGSKEVEIEIKVAPKIGQDIRPIGSDIVANSLVLQQGECINVGHVGVLAAVGKTQVRVYKRPKIGILSTGNELQTPYEDLKPGHIRDSNKLTLINLLQQYSYEATDCGIVKDDPDSVKSALTKYLLQHDIVITTGGVSMGEFDMIKQVLVEDFQAVIHFGRVNMKPGKPTTFATCIFDGKLKIIFGLPGNPVSATVTSVLFVIPALRQYENNPRAGFPKIRVALAQKIRLDSRPEYMRVELKKMKENELLQAYPTGNQISSRLNSFTSANALLCVPAVDPSKSRSELSIGDILDAMLLEPISLTDM